MMISLSFKEVLLTVCELLVISLQEKKVHIAYKLTHWSECLHLLLTVCIQPRPHPPPMTSSSQASETLYV